MPKTHYDGSGTTQECASCTHWDPDDIYTDENYGLCRVAPPTFAIRLGMEETAAWPVTQLEDWCGVYEPDWFQKADEDGT